MINSPSSEPPPRPSDSPQSSSTTAPTPLPSIRHLHPYLSPSGVMSQRVQSERTLHGLPQLQPPPAYYPGPSSRLESDALGHSVDSDNDDPDSQGPPKKKRRRQALSCTECKRRKIKCDRNQPCAPCSRRGEQAKCQWHVVEPVRLISRSAPSSSSSSEKYVSRAEYDELKSRFELLEASVLHRFEYLDRFMSTHPLSMAEPGSLGSATSGHSPSGSGSSAPRTTPAAAVAAQHVTDVPVAVPDYNQGPSTGYGTAGTPGDGLVPATNFPSSFSKSSTAGLAHFSPLMHQSNTASYIKYSPPPEHLMHPPNLPEVLHRRKSSLVKEYTSTGHNYQPIGPLGSTSSASSGIHTRQRSLSSIASIGSRSPIPDHSASGMAAASSPVLQHRMVRVSSSITPTATSSAVKNPAFSLASITSPFDSEPGFSSRASGVPIDAPLSTPSTPRSSNGSPTIIQSKNFRAQTLKPGERLRHLNHIPAFTPRPCTHPLPIIRTLLTQLIFTLILLILHILRSTMMSVVAEYQDRPKKDSMILPTFHHLLHRCRLEI